MSNLSSKFIEELESMQQYSAEAKPVSEIPQPTALQKAVDWQQSRLSQPMPKQVIDFKAARSIFLKFWINRIQSEESFTVVKENRVHVNNLIKWAICDPECDFPLNKSVWLWGLVGSGKSTLAKALHDLLDYLQQCHSAQSSFGYYDMDLLLRKAEFNHSVLEVLTVPKNLIMDELKESHKNLPLPYGMKFRIGDFVSMRYSMWKERSNLRMLVTTNLPPIAADVFDQREFSRMTEMFKSIEWQGGSLRPDKNLGV